MSIREVMANKLREARNAKGLTAAEVGSQVGKSAKAIYSWESGQGQPDADMLIELSRLYGLKVSDFYSPLPIERENSWVEIPFFGSIAAGVPIEMIDVDDTYLVPSKIVKEHEGHHLGVMQIHGNSFNAGGIYDSFYVVVDFDDKEPTNSHDPFAVSIDNSTATVKAIEELENGIRLLPNSYDPTIQPMTFIYDESNDRDVSVLGKIIWTFAPFDYSF